jgi:tol-pal system protein YbgF
MHQHATLKPWLAGTPALCAGVLLWCVLAGPAAAQSTRDRLNTLESSVARLEHLLENNQGLQTRLLRRIQELQTENQSLRNDIDQLQFESRQNSDRQRQLYLDLDQRLQTLEARGEAVLSAADAPAAAAVDDTAAYQAAFELLKQGRYDKAQAGFQSFLATFANSTMRGNAQYWLAETSYVTKAFETALTAFQKVIVDYPTSRKIPDAWLKIGYCNYELERWADARIALSTLVSRYGESTTARLAKQRLDEMQAAGH